MNQASLEAALAGLPVGACRYFDRLDSTNDEAARWVGAGAPDAALVVADEQTAGRGRAGRHWLTPPQSALAFSLILYPSQLSQSALGHYAGLGALAVSDVLSSAYHLPALIKWPNDVLVNDRKLCGILVETQWDGPAPSAAILGIGINVAAASVSAAVLPASGLIFPAGSVESALGAPVERLQLLQQVLAALFQRRAEMGTPQFIQAWEERLAYRGEWVSLSADAATAQANAIDGELLGLAADGSLRLRTLAGQEHSVQAGDLRLRRVE